MTSLNRSKSLLLTVRYFYIMCVCVCVCVCVGGGVIINSVNGFHIRRYVSHYRPSQVVMLYSYYRTGCSCITVSTAIVPLIPAQPRLSTLISNRSFSIGEGFYQRVLVKSWPLSSSSAVVTTTTATGVRWLINMFSIHQSSSKCTGV
jgi:hypothetical protein